MEYTYNTKGVCATRIKFNIEGNVVSDIEFTSGCPGNLNFVSKALDGDTIEHIIKLCEGNTCGPRNTSCVDQLALAVRKAYKEMREDREAAAHV
jgi:uncharacterized protein (TIGR03905 family)